MSRIFAIYFWPVQWNKQKVRFLQQEIVKKIVTSDGIRRHDWSIMSLLV